MTSASSPLILTSNLPRVDSMHILPAPLSIGETEGFTPEKDIFKRSEFGRGLTNIVQQIEDPLVILLDSPWGTGKTTFLEMWAGELRKLGHPVIYFDAFAHDHIENAFLAIAGEIIGLAQAKKAIRKTKVKRFLDIAAKAGGVILRQGSKIGVKAATLGAIDAADLGDGVKGVADEIAGTASEHVDDYIKNLLTKQADEKETLVRFKAALGELALEFSSHAQIKKCNEELKNGALPLVFILDELDRCRPPFALDLLETIKHLFSVDNVHFVLSANLNQLEASVKFSYGSEIDAKLYLQKFYNFSISFPTYFDGAQIRKIYIKNLYQNLDMQRHEKIETVVEAIEYTAEARGFSLRTIERIMSTLNFAFTMASVDEPKLPPIVAGLCIMKVCNPEIFNKAKNNKISMKDVEITFGFSQWAERHLNAASFVRKWWIFCVEKDLPPMEGVNWENMAGSLWGYNHGDRTELVQRTAHAVIEPLSTPM
ncbi:P-loop NTPase fold protein [Xanthobacter sp. AM33]|uniref:KAP family P-loop NTPase fold protein n=1 Tax=Xanthobacter sp. AM33 TaxID=3380644 RepID=UPI0039BF25B7